MHRIVLNIAICWLLLMSGSQIMASNGDTAFLRSNRKVVECDAAKKSIIITLDIGEISKSDSLYGYNYRIDFDNSIVDFHSALYLNTLSEAMQYRNTFFYNSEGYVEGYAANLVGPPVAGNRPLLGLFGDFIGDCNDTAVVSINYLDFTDEFGKSIEYFDDIKLFSVIEDNDDSFLSVEFSDDTISGFNDEMISQSIVKLKTKKGLNLNEVELRLKLENNKDFEISDISSISELIDISNVSINEDNAYIKFYLLDDIEIQDAFQIELRQLNKTNDLALLKSELISINECACITRLNDNTSYIKGIEKDTTVNVIIDNDNYLKTRYDAQNQRFVIEGIKNEITSIEIYDINGNMMNSSDKQYDKNYVDCSGFPVGAYIMRIQLLDRKQYINLLIKY